MPPKSSRSLYEFGPFLLDPTQHMLLRQGRPVGLAPKVFETLRFLVENHGQLVTKQDLISAVWPDVTVQRGSLNLTIHITRKTLGREAESDDDYIQTVPRCGYRFVATVRVIEPGMPARNGAGPRAPLEVRRPETAEPLSRVLGHHLWYVLTSSALFGSLFGVSMLIQVAYEFDRHRTTALTVGSLAACAMFVCSVLGFALDLKGMAKRTGSGLPLHCLALLMAAGALFISIQRFLPSSPVVRATFQTYTAQAAYLKDISYFLVLAFLFVVIPFNFISAAEREIAKGISCNLSHLLSGNPKGVPPKGTVYLSIPVLIFFLLALASIAVYAMVHLFNNLESAPYMNLYMQAIYLRWIVYFGIGVLSVTWYYRELNAMKLLCSKDADD